MPRLYFGSSVHSAEMGLRPALSLKNSNIQPCAVFFVSITHSKRFECLTKQIRSGYTQPKKMDKIETETKRNTLDTKLAKAAKDTRVINKALDQQGGKLSRPLLNLLPKKYLL